MKLIIKLNDVTQENLDILESRGASIETSYKNQFQVTVSAKEIEQISELIFVDFILEPIRPVQVVTSEGTGVINSDDLNLAGITGSGVNVAVIDLAFDITDPEISSRIVESQSFRADGMILPSGLTPDHGNQVAQIVNDVAPDANLYLYNFDTSIEFLNMVDTIITSKPIDIVVMSIVFFNAGWYDGTSQISQKITEARNDDILWVNAVGNNAQQHWGGQFTDTDFDGFHNFLGDDETITFIGIAGEPFNAYLSWDDWSSPSEDYDFLLLDSSFTILAASTNNQLIGFPPDERIFGTLPVTDTYHLVIQEFFSTTNVNFELFVPTHNLFEHNVISSSIPIAPDAVGSFSVGAFDVNTNILESFSSRGPTNDNRIKPDFIGPDNVSTSFGTVFGTSFAAPHAAGAAALLLEQFPTSNSNDLQNLLEFSTASFHSKSNDDGTGRLDLSMFVGIDVIVLDNENVNCTTNNSCYYPHIITVNQGDVVTWATADDSAVTITSGTPGGGPDGIFDSGLITRGDSFSHQFTTPGNFDYFDLLHPWATGQIIVNANTCSPPGSGDWIITSSCILSSTSVAAGNVIIQNNSVLTIPAGMSLDINFITNFLRVESGSGLLIKAGGYVT